MAKRYVREPGRTALTRAPARRRVVSSILMPLELHSAFWRRALEGTLAIIPLPLLFERVAGDRIHWTLVAVTTDVLTAATTLLETHPLRTVEALHVASAHVFHVRMNVPVLFVSADRRQLAAASHAGLTTMALGE
jgi:predicted nucleic acid-binding protein